MPSREVSRIGGLDLCQAKAKTKARHRASWERSIGRSFKRSEYFHASAGPPSVGCRTPRSFRALAGMAAAIALLGRTTGRWGAPEGVVAIGVTSKARESRYQTRRTAWSTGTEHRRSRTAPGLSRCRNPRHFPSGHAAWEFAFAYVAAQRRTPLQIPIYGPAAQVSTPVCQVTRDDPVVSGCGYATPLVCASRSASNRRICSSGGTEPGVVSCRRIASLIALVAAAADFSASEGPGRGWFGVSFTLRCRIHCLLPAGLGRHVACVPGVRAHQCVRIGESRDTHSPTNDANRRPSVVRREEGVSLSAGRFVLLFTG